MFVFVYLKFRMTVTIDLEHMDTKLRQTFEAVLDQDQMRLLVFIAFCTFFYALCL